MPLAAKIQRFSMPNPVADIETDALSALDVDVGRGLSSREAARRLARHGPNVVAPERRESFVAKLLRPLRDPMALLLLGAGVIYLVLGDYRNASVMFIALVPIALIDFILESRAERALARLRRLVAARAEVLREGRRILIPSEDLVLGDVVFVREGDVVPADGVLIEASDVQADESSLTGESLPVPKEAGNARFTVENRVLAGTTVLSGRGTMVVVATGPRTSYGQIAELVGTAVARPTPTQQVINRLVRQLGIVAGVVCMGVVGLELLRGNTWSEAFLAGVSLAIAAIPEEFSVVFALYLTLGAWRMAHKNALIRRLVGVGTLGRGPLICADKPGTLTMGTMKLTAIHTGGEIQPIAQIRPSPLAAHLAEAAVLASEPKPYDPLEQAIIAFAPQAGVDVDRLYAEWTLVHEYTFDPRRKYMSHVWRSQAGRLRLSAKGAMEGILDLCAMNDGEREVVLQANRRMTGEGMRVIAVAEKDLPTLARVRPQDESGLHFVGLIGFVDPPRCGVREAIAECLKAGIRVVMITGDHPLTAHSVAQAIGLPHRDRYIMTGDEMEAMADEELRRAIPEVNIFARITPVQKHRLVRLLKELRAVVAMTGDGINDAPALKEADVGVAMGQRGTEVAREAATMVLLDDNFRTIVEAVREGRRIYDNLGRAFRYLVAFHLPIISLAFVVPLVGAPLVLLPAHLVWLELILHPTASVVFEEDPPDPDIMWRPPRDPGQPFLTRSTAVRVVAEGLAISVAAFAVYFLGIGQGFSVDKARSLTIALIVLAQMLLVLVERSPERPFWEAGLRGNRALPIVLAGSLASLLLLLYVPSLASAMSLAPLTVRDWSVVTVGAIASTMWIDVVRIGRRVRGWGG